MNFFEHMDFTGKELHIDVASHLKESHEQLRQDLETCLGSTWRITRITEESTATYEAMLATRTTSNPVYTRYEVRATFRVEARENGALEKIVEGDKVSIPKKTLHFRAELLDNGHLRIGGSAVVFR